MKRKTIPATEPIVIVPEVLDTAMAEAPADKSKRPARCVVCNSETSPNSHEGLCWVCRRLKISAWRDSDTQMPAQE